MTTQHTDRLERLDQLFIRTPIYFITTCTYNRQRLLANDPVHAVFVTFCRCGLERGVFVGRYVLMPDHLHLFVAFGSKESGLSIWMKSLKNCLSKRFREKGIPAPHWQKGYFDHVMRSQESCSAKWKYVVMNPVRAGLVREPKDWPYQGEIHPLEGRCESL